jgi:predicted transcriptional regulator
MHETMSKKKVAAPLSGAQLEIMNFAWGQHEVTVTDVWKALSERKAVARNTVLTVMDRLVKKGWLKRTTCEQPHRYRPARSRGQTLGQLVARLVDSAFRGSAEDLVVALLHGRGVTADEAKRIQELIDESRRSQS